jgi:hypothetical protein
MGKTKRRKGYTGQTMQCSKQKGEKDRQYNGQNKKETRIDRTENPMVKTKRRKG